jgi:hypothetical protein
MARKGTRKRRITKNRRAQMKTTLTPRNESLAEGMRQLRSSSAATPVNGPKLRSQRERNSKDAKRLLAQQMQ